MAVHLNMGNIHGWGPVALKSIGKLCFYGLPGHCPMLEGIYLFSLCGCTGITFKSLLTFAFLNSTLSQVLMLHVLTLYCPKQFLNQHWTFLFCPGEQGVLPLSRDHMHLELVVGFWLERFQAQVFLTGWDQLVEKDAVAVFVSRNNWRLWAGGRISPSSRDIAFVGRRWEVDAFIGKIDFQLPIQKQLNASLVAHFIWRHFLHLAYGLLWLASEAVWEVDVKILKHILQVIWRVLHQKPLPDKSRKHRHTRPVIVRIIVTGINQQLRLFICVHVKICSIPHHAVFLQMCHPHEAFLLWISPQMQPGIVADQIQLVLEVRRERVTIALRAGPRLRYLLWVEGGVDSASVVVPVVNLSVQNLGLIQATDQLFTRLFKHVDCPPAPFQHEEVQRVRARREKLTERWVFLYGCASQPPAD